MTNTQFSKILIANRGEIACRVINTARKLGVATVAVYSDADANAMHVSMADEAVYIGAASARESYLDYQKVIDAALLTGAQAIHPGYGFLSENAEFAAECQRQNIVFIGPPIAAIEAMGSKSAAKTIMEKADVPLVPGYHGDDQSRENIHAQALKIGYPVLLKAVAGGGGKGMRQVHHDDEFDAAFDGAKRESLNSFANDDLLVEKYLTRPRHVEFQIFCDSQGNGVYLFERDCSLQRRHQKVIEEAPAPGMTEALRAKMGQAALRAAKAINYQGAGTVEFLLDSDGSFYFMEMNTRLQVEHPITEMITGVDLVQWQLLVAAGEPLPMAQAELSIKGHAFEARIYAEDPAHDFLPMTGKLSFLQLPQQSEFVRVDTGVRQGDEVSVYYDPMIAKLITWDTDRDRALQRLTTALKQYHIIGVTTNISFLHNLADSQPFKDGLLDTSFIETHHKLIFKEEQINTQRQLCLIGLLLVLAHKLNQQQHSASNQLDNIWHSALAWRMNASAQLSFNVELAGQEYTLVVEPIATGYQVIINDEVFVCRGELDGHNLRACTNGHNSQCVISTLDYAGLLQGAACSIFDNGTAIDFTVLQPDLGDNDAAANGNNLLAPMNGTMVALLVEPGQRVKQNQPLLVMEAMKMEHTVLAPADGQVIDFYYAQGDMIDGGAQLVNFELEQG
ncbi:acetyl/propionyl/methylcrotonyl-CoA carboxylase subunit alpha [Paraferrimonas sp. SM1919]|uniref:acetyl/propionyl/methylcrotonyl-CoA carboxylase subunit alpha n=1 Tax=Paraferrimonas sp. SM1919 TaxID=2662263 RepID=UPI0013D4A793|nr:acetyl/propionyl/methylcrotonyl-CoA carboxylase subunit alpha [Paraferrimonas sp. SM1919]